MTKTTRRTALIGLTSGLLAMTALSGANAQSINLTYLIPSGPDGVAVSVTHSAAEITAARLWDAAETARKQNEGQLDGTPASD